MGPPASHQIPRAYLSVAGEFALRPFRDQNGDGHQARHGFGVLLISESISIESIAKMMGHSNITTTQGYARITEEKISKEMDKLMEKRNENRTNSDHNN